MSSAPLESLDVIALGVVVRIRFDDDLGHAVRDRIAEAWSGATVPNAVPDEWVDASSGASEPQLLESLSVQVTLKALEFNAGKLLMLHAAGIALPDGRVVAFVGPSGRGKTTLSRVLGSGFGYVSDETIGIDAMGHVLAHRKPLSVVCGEGPKQQVAPAAAGLMDLPDAALRLAGLVLLERHSDPVPPYLECVPLIEAMAALVPETSYLTSMDAPLQRIARLCDRTGGVLRLHYSDAPTVLSVLPEIFEDRSCGAWSSAPQSVPREDGCDASRTDDAILADGLAAVLVSDQLVVLDGIGPSVWEAVHTGADLAGTVKAVTSVHGEPENADATYLVKAAMAVLVDRGVLDACCLE